MGEGNYLVRLFALSVILAINAYFSAVEVALVAVRSSRLQAMADRGNLGAQSALALIRNPERLLSVCQFGITLGSLLLGLAGEETLFKVIEAIFSPFITPSTERMFHWISFGFGFFLMSFLHVVIGEVVPKNLALENADRLAILMAPSLLVFDRITGPIVFLIERTSAVLSRWLGLKGTPHGGGHSAEELKFILSSLKEKGELQQFEEDMMRRVLELANLVAREIMVPRHAVVSVPITATLDRVIRSMIEYQYARLPVYRDGPENIVGVIHYKDLLPVWEERRLANAGRRPTRPFRLEPLLRKPIVVPETKPLTQMIVEFRHNHSKMAIVVDEFGTIAGIVTLEDVLEQIVGEIVDEHDELRATPALQGDDLELEGTTTIRSLETQYGMELPAEAGFETLAGFLLFELGRIPQPGDHVEYGLRRFTVMEMERNRIAKVKVEKIPPQEQPELSTA